MVKHRIKLTMIGNGRNIDSRPARLTVPKTYDEFMRLYTPEFMRSPTAFQLLLECVYDLSSNDELIHWMIHRGMSPSLLTRRIDDPDMNLIELCRLLNRSSIERYIERCYPTEYRSMIQEIEHHEQIRLFWLEYVKINDRKEVSP